MLAIFGREPFARPWNFAAAAASLLMLFCAGLPAQTAPFAGPNVDMVCGYGSDFSKCDPSLTKQNEPTIAASTRNPHNLIAGANDYRGTAVAGGDSWVSVLKSTDGGVTWSGGLHPGCPETGMCPGSAPAIQGFQAASDPTVRCGPNGLCFFTGIAFNRTANALGVVFISRWIDDNNASQAGQDTFRYIDTTVLDSNTSGQLQDKPWLAVDKPRPGSPTVTIPGAPGVQQESFAFGNVYVVYSTFVGSNNTSQVRLVTSTDGGTTWGKPVKVSASSGLVQGATVAIDPVTGMVVIAWRQFGNPQQPDAIVMVTSSDKGRSFTVPVQVAAIHPFDQGESNASIRLNTFPSLAISVDPTYPANASPAASRAYLAWADRVGPVGADGVRDSRMVIASASLANPSVWTPPVQIDTARSASDPQNASNPSLASGGSMRGHQFEPALTYANGVLMIVYYDTRDDGTFGQLQCLNAAGCPRTSDLTEVRVAGADLAAGCFNNVFNGYLVDAVPTSPSFPAPNPLPVCNAGKLKRRHTVDVRAAQAIPDYTVPFSADALTFNSNRISQYTYGIRSGTAASASNPISQERFNLADLALFHDSNGNPLAFFGDYNDVTAAAFIPTAAGQWEFNSSPATTNSPVFYGAWTSNQMVSISASCPDGPGSKNQDVFAARISPGLAAYSRRNFRQLGPAAPANPIQRAFAFNVQNMTNVNKCVSISVANPASGTASFLQNSALNAVNAQIWRKTTIARTVYVTSSNPTDKVAITVNVTGTLNRATGVCTADTTPLQTTLLLNPDSTNPISPSDSGLDQVALRTNSPMVTTINLGNGITDQGIQLNTTTVDLTGTGVPNTDAVTTDAVTTDAVTTDAVTTDAVTTDAVSTDAVTTDAVTTDAVTTDAVTTDAVTTDAVTGAVQDLTTQVSNTGTTDTFTNLRMLQQAATQCQPAGSLKCQLFVTRIVTRPVVLPGCVVKQFVDTQLVGRISVPTFVTATSTSSTAENTLQSVDQTTGDISNATAAVGAGERLTLTLRMIDPDQTSSTGVHFCGTTGAPAYPGCIDPANAVKHVPAGQLATSGVIVLPFTTTTMTLPNGIYNKAYSVTMKEVGAVRTQTTWSLLNGNLPTGISLSSTGVIGGTPKVTGVFTFTIQATGGGQLSTQKLTLTVTKVNGSF